ARVELDHHRRVVNPRLRLREEITRRPGDDEARDDDGPMFPERSKRHDDAERRLVAKRVAIGLGLRSHRESYSLVAAVASAGRSTTEAGVLTGAVDGRGANGLPIRARPSSTWSARSCRRTSRSSDTSSVSPVQ